MAVFLVLADLAVALAVGWHVLVRFSVRSQVDTRPPICWNGFGDEISCGTSPTVVLGAAVLVGAACLAGLIWVQRRIGCL